MCSCRCHPALLLKAVGRCGSGNTRKVGGGGAYRAAGGEPTLPLSPLAPSLSWWG